MTVSAESHGLVNERVSHHRVVLGVLRDAQIPAYRPHTSVQTLGCARIRCTRRVRGGARSNGYSVMVSAESHGLVNERVSHHRVVSVCLGMLKHRRLGRIKACRPSGVCSNRMNRELQRRARSNGF